MKLFKAMATVAGFTMVSRVTGMVRDMLTASYLGAGPIADAFFVALKLPNFFRRIAGEGAFSVSFIPLYSKTIAQEGEEEAAKFAGQVFSLMTVILGIFTAVMMVLMPFVIHVIAPGFEDGTQRYEAAVSMTLMSFPYLMLICLTALFGGILNAHNKFAPFAAAPILFNLTLIAALLLGHNIFPTAGHAMALGISASGVLQVGLMVYFLRRHKIQFHFQPPRLTEKVRKLFRLMGPGVIGAGVFQINLFIDMMIASLLAAGSISYLYYADRLNQLPLSIAGIAVGTALLPMLSRALSAGNHAEGRNLYNRSLEFCCLIAIPAAVALLIVPIPMVATLYEHGKFSYQDTLTVAYVLMGYGVGLPAYVAGKVLMTAFWSRHDTITPVKISIITAVCNSLMAFALIWTPLGVAGISLSTGLAGWIQIYLLRRALKDNTILTLDERIETVFPKIVISSVVMGFVLALLAYILQPFFHGAIVNKVWAIVALLGGGFVVYAACIHLTGVLTLAEIKKYMTRGPKDETHSLRHAADQ
jgi:putative peptidoglycan lipid II flippase